MVSNLCPYQRINGIVRGLIKDQTGNKVDQPDPNRATSPTGKVARKAFSDDAEYIVYIN